VRLGKRGKGKIGPEGGANVDLLPWVRTPRSGAIVRVTVEGGANVGLLLSQGPSTFEGAMNAPCKHSIIVSMVVGILPASPCTAVIFMCGDRLQ